jgi:hypothetical protein
VRSMSKPHRIALSVLLSPIVLAASFVIALACSEDAALASVPAYGEVARFGGFETGEAGTGVTYSTTGESSTTNLKKDTPGEQAKFVYPLGMAVDSEDPDAPGKYAIYVLDNVNPQALNAAAGKVKESTEVNLEYRIQKIDDSGEVLASRMFTLKSTTTEPSLHAVSLAVDGPADRVYVLVMDVPPVSSVSDNTSHSDAVDRIDAWTMGRNGAALSPAAGIETGIDDNLPIDQQTGAGELVGPSALQGTGSSGLLSDIDGASIAVYGTSAAADLALAGNRYISANATKPAVELIKTTGAEAGKIDGVPWTNTAETEDAAAKSAAQESNTLYSMSADPGGSLNISLGPSTRPTSGADEEPNMATIGATGLSPTVAVLPTALASENFPAVKPKTIARYNIDGATTIGLTQDIDKDATSAFQPFGATAYAGALAPSVVQLDGGALAAGSAQFPNGLYAGIVFHEAQETEDKQNPIEGSPPSWKGAQAQESDGVRSIVSPASLGVRVFNSSGESLAMIGNVTPEGPCNLQSSPTIAQFNDETEGNPSFVALSAGRAGTLFALVQPDLLNTSASSSEQIAPGQPAGSPVGANMGDQVVEFAPGAGQDGVAGTVCPQPSGDFAIVNETLKEPPSSGSGEVAVLAGTTLKFDASDVDLRGGSPWAYDWDLEGGVNEMGEGPLFEYPWTVSNAFTFEPEKHKAWMWPLSTTEAEFKTSGTYTETLKLVNDFGTFTTQRALRVIAPGAIADTKIGPSAKPTEGLPVVLNASATLPQGDKVKDYHWEFGDSQNEDTGESDEAEHTYVKAGVYTVKLTITDALGQKAQAEESVTVAAAASEEKNIGEKVKSEEQPVVQPKSEEKHETLAAKVETPVIKTTVATKSKPLTTAQKLARALKACKKDKSKRQRASCEKQAKKKYAARPKSKKSTEKK